MSESPEDYMELAEQALQDIAVIGEEGSLRVRFNRL